MSASTESEQEAIGAVLGAEERRLAAIHGSDWSGLSELLGDDVTYTHMSGLFQGKAEIIADLRDKPRTYKRRDLAVRLYGDVAVVDGLLEVAMLPPSSDGTPGRVLNGRVVQVWVKRDDRWQMVVFQATAVPPAGA